MWFLIWAFSRMMSKPPTRPSPLVGSKQAVEHADGGGFARPVGPQEAENLPPVDLKADVVHRDEVPEMPGEILDDNGFFVEP